MNDIEKIKERFSHDVFATKYAGAIPVLSEDGHSECEMELKPEHKNAMGAIMGGALFTLCDFAFAVASNGLDKPYTVTLSSSISYLSQPKSDKLIASCRCIKDGGRTCVYSVSVTDSVGTEIAEALFNGYKLTGK